jgi:penicillin-insensitive murein endopeptidase
LKQQQEAKVLADQRAKEAKEAKEAKDAKKAKEAKEAKAAKDAKAEQDAKAAEDVITEKPESKKATDAKSNKTVQPEPIKQPEPEATSTKNTDSANTSNDELEQEPGGVYKNPVVDYVINSLGKSNRGSQKNAMSLLEKTSSLKGSSPTSVVRPKQQRYYGNPVMINFIVDVSYQLQNNILKDSEWVSEVSDISRKRGGQLSPHKSHQNGLDADIGYLIRDKRSGYYGKDIVNGSRLSSEFLLDEQYEWFKTMNKKQEGKVYCMFVHKVIKREMCRHAQQKSEYFGENDSRNNPLTVEMLRRLQSRPTDHHNHFHLRLKCPANNKGCFEANELSRRSGCE